MDDIAGKMGMSKKTLYQHFADKEDIVTLVAKAHMQRNWQEFDDIRTTAKNAIDELSRISVCLKQNMEDMNPTLLFDLQKYHPKAWNVWLDYKTRCIQESVQRNLKQGIEEGHYRPEINTEILSTVRMALVEIAFDDKTFPQDKFKLPEVQMQIFDHFVYGIVTEKGKKLYQKCKEVNQETSITL
jgi:AcrR family transcriptional regulator